MTIAEIVAAFGAYYLNNGQNLSRLVKILYHNSVTDSALTLLLTDETVYRASESRMSRVLQPFQKAWTPIGSSEFKPVAIEQFKQKIDVEEYPDDLEATWLGFLASDSLDRKEWPFIRWFIEVHVLPKAKEDYEIYEVFAGKYAAPAAGVAGAAGTAMNGIRHLINSLIVAGRITPITMGAIPSDDKLLVDYVEDFADQINTKYWMIPMQLNLNQMLERRFLRGYREKYGKDTDYKTNSTGAVSLTNLTIKGLPSHNGSNKIWCTPKENAIKLGKKTQNMEKVQIESVDRKVKLFSDWFSGVGFVIPEIVFTNDLDLAV